MCEGNLNFQILLDNKDLVAEKVLECIDKNFSIEEQEKIYLTYLSQIKADILSTVNDRGFEKSQIQMLYLTFEYLRESTGKLSNDSACLAF